MIGGLGTPEIIIIVLILLLLFGGKKIPELMRGLGSGVKEFKKATNVEEEPEPRRGYERSADGRSAESRPEDRRLEGGDDRRYDQRPAENERRSEAR